MELPINAPIACTDGAGGHSRAIIVNPVNNLVTHLIVREPGLLGVERMIPIELVTTSTPDQITLQCTKDELAQKPPFVSTHYLMPAPGMVASYGAGTILWPFMSNQLAVEFDRENAATDAVVLHRGAHVHATDGYIGEVEEFLVNPSDSHITHVVLREGHLWDRQDVTIPITQIDHMEDHTIFLNLTKQQIAVLPAHAPTKQGG